MFAGLPAAAQQGAVRAGERQIVVWSVGSPHTGDIPDTTVPPALKLNAGKIGCKVVIEAFPARGFAEIFIDAFEKHEEPDVIAFDNYGILNGISTSFGAFTGIRSSPKVRKSLVEVTGSL